VQSRYDASFEREMGCTAAELLGWLPAASRPHAVVVDGQRASIALAGGALVIEWRELPPRRIALITLPRLAVQFRFDTGVQAPQRDAYMRRFDLYTQRGGG
jgi:hypothetical protein